MYKNRSVAFWLFLSAVLFADHSTLAQQPDVAGATTMLRCEAFCSQTKLRTVNARLIWIDPSMRLDAAARADRRVLKEQIDTTVFKNGFNQDLFASFSMLEGTPNVTPVLTDAAREAQLPAYDLRLSTIQRQTIIGESAMDLVGDSLQKQESSVLIEGLEPGLTYLFRYFVETEGGSESSVTAICEAPVCPADLQEIE